MGSSVWVVKRKGKRGLRFVVRWLEPGSGRNRGKTFGRLEDARVYKAKLRRDLESNDYFAPVKISYRDWVERHLENLRNSPDIDISPKTVVSHGEALNVLGRVCKPARPVDIDPPMIRCFRLALLDEGYRATTVNKFIRTIRSALSYAMRDRLVENNKLIGQHRLCLRTERKAVRVLETGEVTAVMNLAGLPMKAVISLAYYHGLRKGEICYLQWADIDVEQYRLNVVSREGIHRTKTRQNRTIALRRETAELLAKLAQDRLNDFVFTDPKSFYYAVGKDFVELVKQSGIDSCTLHDLRKTCNTLLQNGGVTQETAMQIMGHVSAEVNEKYYTGLLMERQRLAIDSLPAIG